MIRKKAVRLALFLLVLLAPIAARAARCSVLIVCAYNPEANNIAATINAFEVELRTRGLAADISVESLSSDNFGDVAAWRGRMTKILSKYQPQEQRPDVMLLLGPEAVATYLSLEVSTLPDIPVLCGMCSRNYIEIPENIRDTEHWEPETHDIVDVNSLYNIVGGQFYEYNVDANIDLTKKLFPDVRNIVFLTDNSYGGINIRALVKDCVCRHAEFKFNWLDGRGLTVLSAADSIAHLPDSTALMIGTWRYDKDNRYYINSSIMMLRQNNARLPVLTLSASGAYDWAVGGYTPKYQNVGPLLACSLIDFLASGKSRLHFIPCHYVFNYASLVSMGIDEDDLPADSEIINRPRSFAEVYATEIFVVVAMFVVLLAGLIAATSNLSKVKRLKLSLEQKQGELLEAKNKAEANSLLKTSFLADMSHEIRTPLNAIVGFSQVIASQCDTLSADERRKIIEIINKNSNLLTGLLNSILDISRIESGRARYVIEDVEVVDLCRAMLSSVQMANANCGLEFNLDAESETIFLRTDRQRFQQVIVNLLSNAVKFTKEGGVTLSVRSTDDGEVEVAVSDTGRGIPPDKAEEVFARFVKLDEYASGTGLGLSLCRMIVERFGGKIWVDRTYTKGARLVFSMPQAADILA